MGKSQGKAKFISRPHPTVGDILNQVHPVADMLTYKGIQKVAAKLVTVNHISPDLSKSSMISFMTISLFF